jgi:CheY-like chemotaxis protein
MSATRRVVAIFYSSEALVPLLRTMFEDAQYVAVLSHVDDVKRGHLDLVSFVQQHQPDVVVYDLIPPFPAHWQFVDHLREDSPLKNVPFVLTSANAAAATELAGRDEPVQEILGQPSDVDALLKAVTRATQ